MPSTSNQRPGGRTARTRVAVLKAATALFTEVPPGELTVSQIAERAGVNETTIYRRWKTKDALLVDVMKTLAQDRLEAPDTGSLRGDLVAMIGEVVTFLRTPAGFALAYLGASAGDETSGLLRDTFWAERFGRADEIFARAAERGEIRDAGIGELAYEALIGTLHFRILGRRLELDANIAGRLVDLLLDGALQPGHPSSPHHLRRR